MKYLKKIFESQRSELERLVGPPFEYISDTFAIKTIDEKLMFYLLYENQWMVKSDITEGCSMLLGMTKLWNDPTITKIKIGQKDIEKVISSAGRSNPKFWLNKMILSNGKLTQPVTLKDSVFVEAAKNSSTLGDLIKKLIDIVTIENDANKFGI